MNDLQKFLLTSRSHTSSNLEKGGDFLLTPARAIFSGREIRVLSTGRLGEVKDTSLDRFPAWIRFAIKIIALPILAIPTIIGGIIKASCLTNSTYKDLFNRSVTVETSSKPPIARDKLYDDIYTHLLPYLTSLEEKVALVKNVHEKQGVPINFSQTIEIITKSCKELSENDIQALMDMAPSYVHPQEVKTTVLTALNLKSLTKLTLKTNLLNAEDLKYLISKSPRLKELDFPPIFSYFQDSLSMLKSLKLSNISVIEKGWKILLEKTTESIK
jgi:hypothetical protein